MDDLEQLLSDLENVNYRVKETCSADSTSHNSTLSSSSSSSNSFNSILNNKNSLNNTHARNSDDFIMSINRIVNNQNGTSNSISGNNGGNMEILEKRQSLRMVPPNRASFDRSSNQSRQSVDETIKSSEEMRLMRKESRPNDVNHNEDGEEEEGEVEEESKCCETSSNASSSRIGDLAELDSLLEDLYLARKKLAQENYLIKSNYSSNPINSNSNENSIGVYSPSSSSSPSSTSPNSNSLKSQTNSTNSLSTPLNQNNNNNTGQNTSSAQLANSRRSVERLLDSIEDNEFITECQSDSVNLKNASQAAKELENLMASLSMYKNQNEEAEPKEQPNETSQNEKRQELTKPNLKPPNPNDLKLKLLNKNLCFGCDQQINGQVITALGHLWHPDHFVCFHCSQSIGTSIFYEKDNKPYCEEDYLKLFSPKCAACTKPILDKMLTALNKSWHIECFACNSCSKPLNDESFLEINDCAYCKNCYVNELAPKCKRCNGAIVENFISALNAYFHPACFVCAECGSAFNATSFYEYNNMPYCEIHYHFKRGSLCANCQQPINGRCITAMNKKYHPEHFNCSFCLKQLNKGTFKEQNDKPYCNPCFMKLFP